MKKLIFAVCLFLIFLFGGSGYSRGLKHDFCISLSRSLVFSFMYGYAVQSYAECIDLVKVLDDQVTYDACLSFCFKGVDEGRRGVPVDFNVLEDIIYKGCMESEIFTE